MILNANLRFNLTKNLFAGKAPLTKTHHLAPKKMPRLRPKERGGRGGGGSLELASLRKIPVNREKTGKNGRFSHHR